MACLNKRQLSKRSNWDTFLNKIEERSSFSTVSGNEVLLGYRNKKKNLQFVNSLRELGLEQGIESLTVSNRVKMPSLSGDVFITDIKKTAEFGGKPGLKKVLERQEHSFINAINAHASLISPVEISATITVNNVTNAYKYDNVNCHGKEPYTDVVLSTVNGATYNVSMKGTTSPSIAGGGALGIERVVPGYLAKPLSMAVEYFEQQGFKEGHMFTRKDPADLFYKIDKDTAKTLLKGTEDIGGPIDYVYVGPMDVSYSVANSQITFNGTLIDVDSLADKEELYVRIRRRSSEQTLSYKATDSFGYPSIFVGPDEPNRRIEVFKQSQMPKDATILNKDANENK